jgi:hypothetical protein
VFGAWAPGVVKNVDLSFARRLAAVAAPTRLDDLGTIDRAVDVLAEAHGVSSLAAREILVQAAARAGVPLVAVAHMVLRGASAT